MLEDKLSRLRSHDAVIAVVGLGYVGLPLAVGLAERYRVVGFDTKQARVDELQQGRDRTGEVDEQALRATPNLRFTASSSDLKPCEVYIVTVPTPIDEARRPDLRPLSAASETVGRCLKPGNVVIYESTVYPGCTEEDCVPVLEQHSGFKCAFGSENYRPQTTDFDPRADHGLPTTDNDVFHVGYSPERINPGDKNHRLGDIVKVTSGSTPEAAGLVDALYASVITAGTHQAPSIRVAEAAKVIENTQRDVNIGLTNELAMLFGRLGIDTGDVLEAAGTKWNFLPFKPGLVGGHCIGVDPYYLTHKAQQIGFHPQMILAGRRTNDAMGAFVAGEILKSMARQRVYRPGARVLVLGLTFKENCPDLRNTGVIDVIEGLREYNLQVDVHDPCADTAEARDEYGIELCAVPEPGAYAAVALCVAHDSFAALGADGIRAWAEDNGVVYDLKRVLPRDRTDGRL